MPNELKDLWPSGSETVLWLGTSACLLRDLYTALEISAWRWLNQKSESTFSNCHDEILISILVTGKCFCPECSFTAARSCGLPACLLYLLLRLKDILVGLLNFSLCWHFFLYKQLVHVATHITKFTWQTFWALCFNIFNAVCHQMYS